MCTFHGALLLEKVNPFLPSLKFPKEITQTQILWRLSAKKINVKNIQLCKCPHRYVALRGTVWMKRDSETLDLLI